MPRRDGTGPVGAGSMTGRGLGLCTGGNVAENGTDRGSRFGLGLRGRRGGSRSFGRCIVKNQDSSKTQKELLEERKAMLQNRLEVIDKQLENL